MKKIDIVNGSNSVLEEFWNKNFSLLSYGTLMKLLSITFIFKVTTKLFYTVSYFRKFVFERNEWGLQKQ